MTRLLGTLLLLAPLAAVADEPAYWDDGRFSNETLDVWPDLAPGETSEHTGDYLPPVGDNLTISRVVNIRKPTVGVYRPEQPNGVAVVILPGGGFARVVPDLEGSEAAKWLNQHGITCFVIRYRTSEGKPANEPAWQRPLQDTQRALRTVRAFATDYQIDPEKVGLLAFSAGGQIGAIAHIDGDAAAYQAIDEIDEQPCHPDFAMLIYPWRILDTDTGELIDGLSVTQPVGPTFIIHTNDDRSTAAGAALLYVQFKNANVPTELHIFERGGHGYGVRGNDNNFIGTWPRRADDWLKLRGLIE